MQMARVIAAQHHKMPTAVLIDQYMQLFKLFKNKYPLSATLIAIIFSGCVSYKGIKLSALTINSKKANNKILDRYPDYGDGHKDGCLVMAEMQLDLKIDKPGQIQGKVSDVQTGKPLKSTSILLKTCMQQDISLTTDSLGSF
jgi:hypothetical protein